MDEDPEPDACCITLLSINEESEAFRASFRVAVFGGEGDLRPVCDFWLRSATCLGARNDEGIGGGGGGMALLARLGSRVRCGGEIEPRDEPWLEEPARLTGVFGRSCLSPEGVLSAESARAGALLLRIARVPTRFVC